jgi:hypothetical protein
MRNRIVGGRSDACFGLSSGRAGALRCIWAGQTVALVFAVLLVVVGGYYLLKGSGKKL